MGTKGYLIFKYTGIYYVIYNQWDSYPSGMGMATVKVLINLCKQFKGNATLARLYLRDLFKPLVERSNQWHCDKSESRDTTPMVEILDYYGEIDESKLKTLNESSNQHYIIWKHQSRGFQIDQLKLPKGVIEYEVEPSSTPPNGRCIDYMWEVDLDEGRFGMGTGDRGNVFVYWPWKALYLMPVERWNEDAEMYIEKLKEGYISITPFERMYKVILIQAYVRRFLAKARAMKPPNGLFYVKAKRKFEELQKSYLI